MTDTEVQKVEGEAGHFTVTAEAASRAISTWRNARAAPNAPRYAPSSYPATSTRPMSTQRAAYKLYPQAVPNAFAIEKKGVAPCRNACPSGQRVQGYIALIREGRYEDALRVIKEDNPFPGHLRPHLQPSLRGRL